MQESTVLKLLKQYQGMKKQGIFSIQDLIGRESD